MFIGLCKYPISVCMMHEIKNKKQKQNKLNLNTLKAIINT